MYKSVMGVALAILVAVVLTMGKELPGDEKSASPQIGTLLIQSIPARHYLSANIETDFEGMGKPVVEALTLMDELSKEQKVGLRGPVVHFYHGAPHQRPNVRFRMETGFLVSEGTKGFEKLTVRELPPFKCASVLYVGPGNHIGDAWQALYRSLRAKGLTPTDEERELYLYWESGESPNNVVQVQVGVK